MNPSSGGLSSPAPDNLTNEFATIKDVSVNDLLKSDRIDPNQIGTGAMRGTQSIVVNDGKIVTLGNTPADPQSNVITNLGRSTGDDSYGLRVYDSSNSRLLAGKYPNGDIKIKLSQAGFDVETATDDQLIWSSDFNLFKIVNSGTAVVTVTDPINAGTRITTTVPHGLTSTPAVICFVNVPTYAGYTGSGQLTTVPAMVLGTVGASGGQIFLIGSIRVDPTNTYFDVQNPSTSNLTALGGDWTFKYYVLRETAN